MCLDGQHGWPQGFLATWLLNCSIWSYYSTAFDRAGHRTHCCWRMGSCWWPVNMEGATTHSRLRAAVSEWVSSTESNCPYLQASSKNPLLIRLTLTYAASISASSGSMVLNKWFCYHYKERYLLLTAEFGANDLLGQGVCALIQLRHSLF